MNGRRTGFTLFEVILAIALSAVLLALIGTAINLYLVRVDASRTRVEEAQLARSILSMIADDIRATTIYQPQDTSAIAKLMAKGTSFDVDSIDKAKQDTGDTSGTNENQGGGGTGNAASSSGSTGSSSAGTSTNDSASDVSMPLGLNGTLEELYVDATRLPQHEELFSGATGYTNAASPAASGAGATGDGATALSGVAPPTDLKTVHYFVRPGEAVEAGSVSTTSLDPVAQSRVGGLVRESVPRNPRHGGAIWQFGACRIGAVASCAGSRTRGVPLLRRWRGR